MAYSAVAAVKAVVRLVAFICVLSLFLVTGGTCFTVFFPHYSFASKMTEVGRISDVMYVLDQFI